MALLLLEVVTLSCAGIFAGGLLMVMCALVPSWLSMLPGQWVLHQQRIGPYIDLYMPILDIVTCVGTIVLMCLSWHIPGIFWSCTGALCCLVVVACISQLANVPMNRRIRSWSSDALPTGSLQLRQHWITWHFIRTVVGVAAFVLLLFAILS